MPAAIERIQNTYNVIRYTTPLMTPANKTTCNNRQIPTELSTVGVPDTDLYILVLWVHNETAKFAARAISCALDATTSRYIYIYKKTHSKKVHEKIKIDRILERLNSTPDS